MKSHKRKVESTIVSPLTLLSPTVESIGKTPVESTFTSPLTFLSPEETELDGVLFSPTIESIGETPQAGPLQNSMPAVVASSSVTPSSLLDFELSLPSRIGFLTIPSLDSIEDFTLSQGSLNPPTSPATPVQSDRYNRSGAMHEKKQHLIQNPTHASTNFFSGQMDRRTRIIVEKKQKIPPKNKPLKTNPNASEITIEKNGKHILLKSYGKIREISRAKPFRFSKRHDQHVASSNNLYLDNTNSTYQYYIINDNKAYQVEHLSLQQQELYKSGATIETVFPEDLPFCKVVSPFLAQAAASSVVQTDQSQTSSSIPQCSGFR